jgi:hypothetical protein
MPPKRRKRRREDESVIKTEPDTRRADRENDDTFELTDEEAEVKKTSKFTTVEYNRYLRSKARSKARKSSQEVQLHDPFPFLRLSPEIRNMIYRYLVVSKSPYPIRLDSTGCISQGGIETAILVANRQVRASELDIVFLRTQTISLDRVHKPYPLSFGWKILS